MPVQARHIASIFAHMDGHEPVRLQLGDKRFEEFNILEHRSGVTIRAADWTEAQHWPVEQARALILAEAIRRWCLSVRDGSPTGDQLIEEWFRLKDYENGRVAWCGKNARDCLRAGGVDANVESVGKALAFGGYGLLPDGRKAFDAYPTHLVVWTGERWVAMSARDYHDDQPRLVTRELDLAEPGDIILHQDPDRLFNGHVMLCLGIDQANRRLVVIEGNAFGLLPPVGKTPVVAEGVAVRSFGFQDPYLDWLVKWSPRDLGQVQYLEAAAAKEADRRNREGVRP